jgi:ketosteroid isomerase-like protein
MSDQQAVETVKRGYELFGQGDIAGFLNLLDEHVEWYSPGPSELPTAGVRKGRQAVGDFFATLDKHYEFQRFEPRQFIAQGDTVVVLGEDTVRVKTTGTVLTEEWAHVFTLSNGRVTRFHEYMDTAGIVTDLRAAQTRL